MNQPFTEGDPFAEVRKIHDRTPALQELVRQIKKDARMEHLHQLMDMNESDIPRFPGITCKKGCSGCCDITVLIYEEEANFLAHKIKSGEISVDTEKISKVVDAMRDDWIARAECPFLKDNACSIYKYRPMACRVYLRVGDPKDCSTPGAKIHTVIGKSEAVTMFYMANFVKDQTKTKEMNKFLLEKLGI